MYYIKEQIFADNRVNILADRLFYYLIEEFTWDIVKEKIVLSGQTAAILHEEAVSPSKNVVWFTNDNEVYAFLLLYVEKYLSPISCIKFKERILLDFGFVKIELWYEETGMDAVNYNSSGVYIHNFEKIPLILL